jgi:uncharacterized protein YjbI with pentapeptide repeats
MNNAHYDIVKQGHDAITKWRAEHATDILDLRGANLRGANLRGANLEVVDLWNADLMYADLTETNLKGADLKGADLNGATLKGVDLTGASLSSAYLKDADLTGAYMWNTIGNCREVKTVQTDLWTVTYTADIMQIGCRRHAIKDWWGFDDATISAMDSKALEWWTRWKPILQQIIVTSPATPTNNKEEK